MVLLQFISTLNRYSNQFRGSHFPVYFTNWEATTKKWSVGATHQFTTLYFAIRKNAGSKTLHSKLVWLEKWSLWPGLRGTPFKTFLGSNILTFPKYTAVPFEADNIYRQQKKHLRGTYFSPQDTIETKNHEHKILLVRFTWYYFTYIHCTFVKSMNKQAGALLA